MTADTTTPLLGLLLQGTGNNNNAWGANLNNSVITPIENAVAGVVTISSLTGGAYSLVAANSLYSTIILTGTLSSDLTITVPSTAKKWTFINNLVSAGFYTLVKTSGNTAVNIPANVNLDITCDGTNMYRADRSRIGEFFYHAGSSVPNGALECTGATPLRLSAVDLYAAIGTTWGVGNGSTTFTLPDGYTLGKFLRSRTASVALGTAQTNQNKAHTHTASGTTATESAGHTHTVSGTTGAMSANASHTHSAATGSGSTIVQAISSGSSVLTSGGSPSSTNTDHTHTFSGTTSTASATHTHTFSATTASDGGTEARPENLSAILCIRY